MALRPVSPHYVRNNANRREGKILYVEDHDANWRITQHGLRSTYEVVRARGAHEALSLLAKDDFSLVLLDIELKGSDLDGIELARVIRGRRNQGRDVKFGSRLPIVFVTAFEERYRRADLLAEGADDVVYKPVDLTRLRLVIARLTIRNMSVVPHGGGTK